jgi:hypothetical protein
MFIENVKGSTLGAFVNEAVSHKVSLLSPPDNQSPASNADGHYNYARKTLLYGVFSRYRNRCSLYPT